MWSHNEQKNYSSDYTNNKDLLEFFKGNNKNISQDNYISLNNIQIENTNGYDSKSYLESIYNNFDFDGYYIESLNIIAILSVASAIYVILSKNPIVSVLFLIFLFLTISLYLMLLGLNFIGLSYLLVYVGAVSILFLFILMLINIRISEIITTTSQSIPLAIIISVLFIYAVYPALPINQSNFLQNHDNITLLSDSTISKAKINLYNNTFISQNIGENKVNNIVNLFSDHSLVNFSLLPQTTNSPMWDTMLAHTGHINSIGNVLYTVYPLWIILTSLVLLLAMVGCILITVK